MRFHSQWREDECEYHRVEFLMAEMQAAAAATGLDVADFRALHAFESLVDVQESRIDPDTYNADPMAVAYMNPLVAAALERRKNLRDDVRCWNTAERRGWKLIGADGNPVPQPDWNQDF